MPDKGKMPQRGERTMKHNEKKDPKEAFKAMIKAKAKKK